MKKQAIFVLGAILLLSGLTFAQIRTITNADLEKFRVKRVQAEKDLRENYEKLGFPSPEELERQNEESRRELDEFADQLRQERLIRESQDSNYIYLDQSYDESGNTRSTYPNPAFVDYGQYYGSTYYNGYYRNRRYIPYRNQNNRHNNGRDYRRKLGNRLPPLTRPRSFNTPNPASRPQINRTNTRIGIRTGRRN